MFLLLAIIFFCAPCLIVSEDPPTVWLGKAPFCDAKPQDCDLFDLDYVTSSITGDGVRCVEGIKVLCKVKALNSSILLSTTPSSELHALTYNIFQRPFIVSHDGQYERTCHLPRAILSNLPQLDVIVFEEGFLGGCFNEINLRHLFAHYGFLYNTPTVGALNEDNAAYHKNSITLTNGGVFMVSRWPILEYRIMIYTNATTMTADRIARKGVVYAKILKSNEAIYHVFATHMQAQDGTKEDSTRFRQAGELLDFIDQINPSTSEPVLIIGDLNSDRLSEPGQVARIMQRWYAQVPITLGSINATYDPRVNDVVEPGAVPQWLDYVVYSKRHRKPVKSSMEGVFLRTDKIITYCAKAKLYPFYVKPRSNLCEEAHKTRFMSDHFPVYCKMIF